jgi:hypothetical protein
MAEKGDKTQLMRQGHLGFWLPASRRLFYISVRLSVLPFLLDEMIGDLCANPEDENRSDQRECHL